MSMFQNYLKDLDKIYALVRKVEDEDMDIEDVLVLIKNIKDKYLELTINGTQTYENDLP